MVIVIIGCGMCYAMLQPKITAKGQSECVAAATALYLVDNTTAMGKTGAITECD